MQERKEAILETAKFYFLNQKYDRAIELYDEGIKAYPDDPDLYFNMGIVYESINDQDNAKKCFEKVLAIDNTFTPAREHLEKIIGN